MSYLCKMKMNKTKIMTNNMKKGNAMTWAVAIATVVGGLTACGIDIPKEDT